MADDVRHFAIVSFDTSKQTETGTEKVKYSAPTCQSPVPRVTKSDHKTWKLAPCAETSSLAP